MICYDEKLTTTQRYKAITSFYGLTPEKVVELTQKSLSVVYKWPHEGSGSRNPHFVDLFTLETKAIEERGTGVINLSDDAMESLVGMVEYCLNNHIALGMGGGYANNGKPRPFRIELENLVNN